MSRISAAVSLRHGIAWVRWGNIGNGLCLRAPWSRKLFSERYGVRVPICKAFGFRLFHVWKDDCPIRPFGVPSPKTSVHPLWRIEQQSLPEDASDAFRKTAQKTGDRSA